MIKVSVMYPNVPQARFDLEYYLTRHVPMVVERCGDALDHGEIERGLNGGEAESSAPFVVIGHLIFKSLEKMQAVFAKHMPEFLADIPNYTDIQPTLQISEILNTGASV